MHRLAVHDRLDPLHIGLPHPIGAPMRVADLDAVRNALFAEITLCQLPHLPGRNMQNSVNYNNRRVGKMQEFFSGFCGAMLTKQAFLRTMAHSPTDIGSPEKGQRTPKQR